MSVYAHPERDLTQVQRNRQKDSTTAADSSHQNQFNASKTSGHPTTAATAIACNHQQAGCHELAVA
eukprot:COSAG06_NODE_3392_length_5410_cov_5.742421_5_plen_66_part_00